MRPALTVAFALVLAACAPEVPDSASGVGFDDYVDYTLQRQQRETALRGGPIVTGTEISDERIVAGAPVPATGAPAAPLPTTGAVTAAATAPAVPGSPTISDEQDFEAVAARETIESDRERLEAQRRAYQVVQPTALPSRSGRKEPSIVEFALTTTNRVGEPVYRRTSLFAGNRFARNCAKYPSSDQAQIAFLKAGGPQRDRFGLDPDGDGFACYWDPQPFRQAMNR